MGLTLTSRVSERIVHFNSVLFGISIPAKTKEGREVQVAGGNPNIKGLLICDDSKGRRTWYPQDEIVADEANEARLAAAMYRAGEIIKT